MEQNMPRKLLCELQTGICAEHLYVFRPYPNRQHFYLWIWYHSGACHRLYKNSCSLDGYSKDGLLSLFSDPMDLLGSRPPLEDRSSQRMLPIAWEWRLGSSITAPIPHPPGTRNVLPCPRITPLALSPSSSNPVFHSHGGTEKSQEAGEWGKSTLRYP